MRFKDKVAVVTGAGQGIGLETARIMAAEGAIVAVNDLRADAAERTAERVRSEGGQAFAIPGSVADPEQVDANVATVMDKCGRIDILVNNAGFGRFSNPETATIESWREAMGVIVEGSFLWSRKAGERSMIPNGSGSIVNLGSLAGVSACHNLVEYIGAKHAVVGMTKALAVEWGKYNIRVNCVCPGTTETEGNTIRQKDPEAYQARIKRIPLHRVGRPEEQAQAIAFLASDQASFINGAILLVDGGLMAGFI